FSVVVTNTYGSATSNEATLTVVTPPPSVGGRHFFYHNSFFDGRNTAADAQDDAAIATDKQALLSGQTATFANVSSYSRGINGIMFDRAHLPLSDAPHATASHTHVTR